MSEQTITTEQISVKPCIKCGAMDRCNRGKCKPCQKEYCRKWYDANRKKIYERNLKWQKENPDKASDSKRKYREANREKISDYSHKRYHSNREKIAKYSRKYYEANRDKVAERGRKWTQANPDKVKEIYHNRRAKIKGNGGKLSKNIVQILLDRQKGKCACCGKSLKHGYHLDHIMPLALGGMNTDDNVQLLTPTCNLRKGAKHPDDWARENGRLL